MVLIILAQFAINYQLTIKHPNCYPNKAFVMKIGCSTMELLFHPDDIFGKYNCYSMVRVMRLV